MTETELKRPTSPFIPGTNIQFAWDSTCIGLIKTCPRLYQYTMIEGYVPKDESIHLRFGIEYHTALQDFDLLRAEGMAHEEALHTIVGDLLERTADFSPDPETKAGKYKSRAALVRTVINYVDHFEDDPARTYILDSGRAAVELSFNFELGYGPTDAQPYLLCGHLDKVVDFNGELYVKDYKTTTGTLGQYYFNQYEPHNQMTLYSLGSKVILKSPVRGVIIDACQIKVDSNTFVRGFTFRNEAQLEEWQTDLSFHLQVAQAYATEGYWPMNDTACDKFGGCRFREVCSKAPSVREIYLKKFTKQPPEDRWNPLKAR